MGLSFGGATNGLAISPSHIASLALKLIYLGTEAFKLVAAIRQRPPTEVYGDGARQTKNYHGQARRAGHASLRLRSGPALRTGGKGETAMVLSRVLLSAIFATLGVALAGCAAPLSRGYYAGGYPYGIHGYYCGEWSVWPGV